MPEGPEAHKLARKIWSFLDSYQKKEKSSLKLTDIKYIWGRYINHGPPKTYDENVWKNSPKLKKIYAIGKKIIFKFEDEKYIVSSLGLSGRWLKENEIESGMRINFIFEFKLSGKKKANSQVNLYFNDVRNFGNLEFFSQKCSFNKKMEKVGPDIIKEGELMEFQEVEKIFSRKKNQNKPVCEVIVDQSNFSGIGNYLRSEILYVAKIDPWKKVRDLEPKELKKLWKKMVSITLKFYYDDGREFKIYGRKETPKGEPVEVKKDKHGRTMWYLC